MTVNDVGLKINLLRTPSSMITLTLFSCCKLKWSWDEFNGQSHILEEQGTTSWLHGVKSPLLYMCGVGAANESPVQTLKLEKGGGSWGRRWHPESHLKPASTNDFARLPMDSSVLEYVVMFFQLQTFHESSELFCPGASVHCLW